MHGFVEGAEPSEIAAVPSVLRLVGSSVPRTSIQRPPGTRSVPGGPQLPKPPGTKRSASMTISRWGGREVLNRRSGDIKPSSRSLLRRNELRRRAKSARDCPTQWRRCVDSCVLRQRLPTCTGKVGANVGGRNELNREWQQMQVHERKCARHVPKRTGEFTSAIHVVPADNDKDWKW
jgi:hypothetical protein